ncbi:MAG TPA: hypothetical protein VFY17_05385, partial [Pilimelia sp.]|nr:hypothetical protein [Pilimelia sp.]
MSEQQDDVVARVLSRVLPSETIGTARPDDEVVGYDGDQQDLADRQALRRVSGLSTELTDVTEVEYRQLRLERVVLAGVWDASAHDA